MIPLLVVYIELARIRSRDELHTRPAGTMRLAAAALVACTAVGHALKTNILLPLYVYPVPGAWDHVYSAIEKNPTLEFQIVINPDSGPGPSSSSPSSGPAVVGYDDNWINATATINAYNNTRTFGYVHLTNGDEALDAVEANITTWRTWADHGTANISLHGIFFDETPDDDAAYMEALVGAARDSLGPDAQVIFNPGKEVLDDSYFALADHVIVSEVTAATYRAAAASAPKENVASKHASHASILVYGFAGGDGVGDGDGDAGGSASELKTWLQGMVAAGIGSVNIVDYGWDASNVGDGPASVGNVSELLVEARASAGRGGGMLSVLVAISMLLAIC